MSTIDRLLDNKNRLVLPPDFRNVLFFRDATGRMILTTIHHSIRGCAIPDWEPYKEDLKTKMDSADMLERNFARQVWGGAESIAPDSQGRILLSKNLLRYSGISTSAILVGLGDYFEIWQPERWEAIQNMDFSRIGLQKNASLAGSAG
ncbi:MAG: cell division/cell wall cluster transcriptional repressor MraZ [Desulfovibrionaceae bacterium]|nr:cell division/cell wall cluster transcriptional repressor MraZ [Desulfovibrionaceae bacterium]